ncbi:MAG: hypothetical protein GY711_10445 [bacterium]|nr:hypothetical protein [bacterium]
MPIPIQQRRGHVALAAYGLAALGFLCPPGAAQLEESSSVPPDLAQVVHETLAAR